MLAARRALGEGFSNNLYNSGFLRLIFSICSFSERKKSLGFLFFTRVFMVIPPILLSFPTILLSHRPSFSGALLAETSFTGIHRRHCPAGPNPQVFRFRLRPFHFQ